MKRLQNVLCKRLVGETHMNDFASLRVLDRFRKIFLKFDIDYDLMRRILQLKLTMDSRRLPPIFNGSKEKRMETNLRSPYGFMVFLDFFC